MARFSDKNLLITSGSSGIGLATAKRLVQECDRVMITGTNEDRLKAANRELGIEILQNDAGDPESIHDRPKQSNTSVAWMVCSSTRASGTSLPSQR